MHPAREVEGLGGRGGRLRGVVRRRPWARLLLALPLVGAAIALPMGPAFAGGSKNLPLNVSPSTGLTGGQSVTITGSGYLPSSIGNVLECNDAPNQPTVNLPQPVGNPVSVSCNLIGYAHLVTTTSSGDLNSPFSVFQGTVGPPCGTGGVITTCPTDSAGHSAAADAALFPCPPTPAQQAAGDVCQLSYGDDGGDESVSTTILFSGEQPPGSTTTTAAPASTTTTTHPVTTATTQATTATTQATTATTQAATTQASSGTSTGPLASTGPGPDLWVVAIIGFVALYLGCITMALVDRPRDLVRRLSRRPVPAAAGDGGASPDAAVDAGADLGAVPVDVGSVPVAVAPAPVAVAPAPVAVDTAGSMYADAGALLAAPDLGVAVAAPAATVRVASDMGMRRLPHRPGAWSASPDARPWSAAPDPRPAPNAYDPRRDGANEGLTRRFVPASWRGRARTEVNRPAPAGARPPMAAPPSVAPQSVAPPSVAPQSVAPPSVATSPASEPAPAGLWLDGWAPKA